MPQTQRQLPKIRIDEAILLAYTMPAQITKSTSISDRETVIFSILPKELLKRLQSINVGLEFHLRKCLRTLVPGKIYFVKYPLVKWKKVFEDVIEDSTDKYQTFARDVLAQKAELEKDAQKFAKKYELDEASCKAILDERYLLDRFRVKVTIIPIKLGSALKFDAVTSEEVNKIEAKIRDTIDEEYRALLNEKLSVFFQMLITESNRLSRGRMTRASTLGRLRRLYDEVATVLAITEERRYIPAFDLMQEFLGNVGRKHEEHERASNTIVAAQIIAETLKVTSSIREKAKPVLGNFRDLVIEEIDKAPTRRRRDEGLKELVAGIQL